MNTKINSNMEFFIQLNKKKPVQFKQKIVAQVPQVLEQENYHYGLESQQKLWEEQMLQNIHIPEDQLKTNQDICEFMYHQLQQPEQSKFIDTKKNVSNTELNEHIENILFLKFVESFSPQIICENQQEQPQQPQNHQQIISINRKNVPTDQIYENSPQSQD
ncbi:unnamed protein product [Paramecium primaurelia]|uniref:Uncharacterized protein n=1 Tax=Paramecium primaurelia TaxID=5886 RepID=A0A8S1NCY1_PARPR|nr:unnamed protein product [Paramecium primaurelia]